MSIRPSHSAMRPLGEHWSGMMLAALAHRVAKSEKL
jgi:hypothetical protein